jgi:endoglucanase
LRSYIPYIGGVVGGPDMHDKYYDIRSDWPQTEVGLDYVAPMLTLAALGVMNDTSDPFYTSLKAGAFAKARPHGKPCDAVFPCTVRFPMAGKIVVGVVVSVVGCVIVGLAAVWMWRVFRNRGGKGVLPR